MVHVSWTTLILGFAVCASTQGQMQDSSCAWNVASELPANPPVLYNSDEQDILLPTLIDGEKVINVYNSSALELSCPGTRFKQWDTDSVRGQCKDGAIYVMDKDIHIGPDLETQIESARDESKRLQKEIQELQDKLQNNEKRLKDLEEKLVEEESNKDKMSLSSMADFGCESPISVTLVPTKTSCGYNSTGHLHHLALLTANNFRTKILICFNKTRRTTLWTKHTMYGAHLNAADKDVNVLLPYDEFGFTHMNEDINTVYRTDTQKFLFGILFITNKAAVPEYFNVSSDLFLTPSLLSPIEDFVTMTDQRAAQAFINVAPLWHTVNMGNWEALKVSIREFSRQQANKLTVYSGVAGVKEVGGRELNLGAIVGEKSAIPVPSILWKVVIEESTSKAVGFLVYNDPHLKEMPKSLCRTVCEQLPWINSSMVNNSANLMAGYTTCCALPDLLAALPQVQTDLRSAEWTLLI